MVDLRITIAAVAIAAAAVVVVVVHHDTAPLAAVDTVATQKESAAIDVGRQKFLSTPITKDTSENPIKE